MIQNSEKELNSQKVENSNNFSLLFIHFPLIMLRIRLARGWKHKSPFYRIVLTEHSKPVKSGYAEVLWWFDPLHHKVELDTAKAKAWIEKWAQPSNRVAKLAYNFSKDEFFKKYVVMNPRTRAKKSDD